MITGYTWKYGCSIWDNLVQLQNECQGVAELYLPANIVRAIPFQFPQGSFQLNSACGVSTLFGHAYPRWYREEEAKYYNERYGVPYRPFYGYALDGNRRVDLIFTEYPDQIPQKSNDNPW